LRLSGEISAQHRRENKVSPPKKNKKQPRPAPAPQTIARHVARTSTMNVIHLLVVIYGVPEEPAPPAFLHPPRVYFFTDVTGLF
jgi:hypothetical protein